MITLGVYVLYRKPVNPERALSGSRTLLFVSLSVRQNRPSRRAARSYTAAAPRMGSPNAP